MVKAISKQFFGAKYERIGKNIFIYAILFCSLYFAEIRINVSPFILYLTSTMFTAAIMWQSLNSSLNTNILQNIIALPFKKHNFVYSYIFVLCFHTLITKTLCVWSIILAISKWSFVQMITAALCGINSSLISSVIYANFKKRKYILALLWLICIIGSICLIHNDLKLLILIAISAILCLIYLWFVNPYTFYSLNLTNQRKRKSYKTGSTAIYIVRYFLSNKSCLADTICLFAVACILPFIFGSIENLNLFPFGFALLCLNTPICTLLSCDIYLEQAMRYMPYQFSRFGFRYGIFIAAVNIFENIIYFISWCLINGGITFSDIITLMLFSFQSAILSLLLEWKYPIKNSQIESDIWHNPRKYIVPIILMLIAALIATNNEIIWIWCLVLVFEVISLFFIRRRLK